MHARRAASEIERAIRGVTKSKGGRSSGQQGGKGIGFPWEAEEEHERSKRAAKTQKRSHTG